MKYFVCLLFLNIFMLTASGQFKLPTKKGDAAETELVNMYLKAKQMGISDNDIKNQLIKKGYPSKTIDEIKKLSLTRMSFGAKSILEESNQSETKEISETAKRDTNWVFKTPLTKEKSPYFGYNFFSEAYLDYTPNTNLATPENYILGPGDQLNIVLTGMNTKEVSEYITPEGYYNLPYVGMINLGGVTIEAARASIREKLSGVFPGLKTSATKLFVSLGELRTIQVMVTGNAEKPGSYVVSSLTQLFNLLYISGGPTELGSLRSIELIRNKKVIKKIDFYEFIRTGILSSEIRLEDQDIIHYPIYNKRVKIEGEVKTPSIFELKENESLADLLSYAGGFTDNAYTKQVSVEKKEENYLMMHNIDQDRYATYKLAGGETIQVGAIDQRYENKVFINGEINRPGSYGLEKQETLSALIKRAGGLKEDAFPNRGFIHRKLAGRNLEMIPFDIEKLLNGVQNDIQLFNKDSIVILSSNSFLNSSYVNVSGGVKNPGKYSFKSGMKVEDLIALAGGFTIDAANYKVELNRLEKNTSETLSNQILQRRKLNIDSSLKTSESSVELEPFDDVFVPRLLNYRLMGNVKIRGEILYEGDYSIEKRDEHVIDIVQRAGGISPFASLKDIQVFRNGLRVGTDIFTNSMVDHKDNSFLLLPGDSIYIPRKNNFVTVKGAVYNEQLIEYNGTGLSSYISAVGGTKQNANLKKVYVKYANGKYKKTHRFMFMRFHPRIQQGSEIIVPEKTAAEMRNIGLSEISGLATLLTSLVAVISILSK